MSSPSYCITAAGLRKHGSPPPHPPAAWPSPGLGSAPHAGNPKPMGFECPSTCICAATFFLYTRAGPQLALQLGSAQAAGVASALGGPCPRCQVPCGDGPHSTTHAGASSMFSHIHTHALSCAPMRKGAHASHIFTHSYLYMHNIIMPAMIQRCMMEANMSSRLTSHTVRPNEQCKHVSLGICRTFAALPPTPNGLYHAQRSYNHSSRLSLRD